MGEKNESFLEILNNYFSNLTENQIVAGGTKERIIIPIEWIFSNKIDRDIIEQAFISLFCKANSQYKEKIKKDRQFYGKIESLAIEKSDSGVNLVAKAKDGGTQTTIVVTSDENKRGSFYAISEEQFIDAVLKAFNFQSSIEIGQKLNLSFEERKRLLREEFARPEINEGRRASIEEEMISVAENLVRYYDYMYKTKKKYEALNGTIQQRKDDTHKKRNRGEGGTNPTRKSEIYDFMERENVLLEMSPTHIVNIDNIEADNTINKFAYITYIYENPRGKEGYLFIAEPFEGIHNTRGRFVSREEYDTLQVGNNKNKFVYLAEQITEMSNDEFCDSKFSKMFRHTSIEKFKEKFRRIILGEEIEKSSEKPRYEEIDQVLFEGKSRITKSWIKRKANSVLINNDLNPARAALYANQRTNGQEDLSITQ